MSYGGYQQYGGNPYGQTGESDYSAANPYGQTSHGTGQGSGYGASNPYGQDVEQGYGSSPPPLNQRDSNYSQPSAYDAPYSAPMGGPTEPLPNAAPLPNQRPREMPNREFLARVDGCRERIQELSSNISTISAMHQRMLSETDSTSSSQQLEHLVSQTSILNTQIRDEIKKLETDAARSGGNTVKDSPVRNLKKSFQTQLEEYQREEATYRKRYQEQIKRQYKIVNPDATEQELNQAAAADWGNEGVFQTALKTNRSGHATSVLGAVRARHNDIQQIERTLEELSKLFAQLNEAVVLDDVPIQQTEEATQRVHDDTTQGNKQLDEGIKSGTRARKLKWWCLFIVVLIIAIIALALGLYFGLRNRNSGGTAAA
ncbi:Plasma membrane t-SNARE, secretory vesicle fusion [Coniosporium apollinis]|uniref:Plasma membrane t-SNARE, secretory vesicle fusion n=1 Tax=Coniosporium apollinis TaxID=61459 RepID=A0ABQ9NSH7_9PEZI|nr:Plasma membrane t-SNARE, secretory vesicle fusion [Coniosporium apollinis]